MAQSVSDQDGKRKEEYQRHAKGPLQGPEDEIVFQKAVRHPGKVNRRDIDVKLHAQAQYPKDRCQDDPDQRPHAQS